MDDRDDATGLQEIDGVYARPVGELDRRCDHLRGRGLRHTLIRPPRLQHARRPRPPGPGPPLFSRLSVPVPVVDVRRVRVGVLEQLVRVDVGVHLGLSALPVDVPVVKVVPVPVRVRDQLVDVLVRVVLPGDQQGPRGHQRQGHDELPPRAPPARSGARARRR